MRPPIPSGGAAAACGVGVRHPDGAGEPEVPFAVGEVEEQRVGGGHRAGGGRGSGASRRAPRWCRRVCRSRIRRQSSSLEDARAGAGDGVLPGVVGRGHLDAHRHRRRSGRRCRARAPGSPSSPIRDGDVPGGVVRVGDAGEVPAGRDAVVVVVAVGDQDGVQPGDVSRRRSASRS